MTQNLEAIRRFILSGMAIFTIVSKKTDNRKTFRVRAAEDVDGSGRPHGFYVDLLIGPDNRADYRYLCFMWIDRGNRLQHKLNTTEWGTIPFLVFSWLTQMIDHMAAGGQESFERQAEFHHAGFCGRCGHLLTDPESIECGLGPVCRGRAA